MRTSRNSIQALLIAAGLIFAGAVSQAAETKRTTTNSAGETICTKTCPDLHEVCCTCTCGKKGAGAAVRKGPGGGSTGPTNPPVPPHPVSKQ
jgi:hypothetical protein